MKVLILLSCTIALASAGWIPFLGHHQEEHHPIIHDGVPLDTPEVQHARAEHFAAVAEAKAKAGFHHEEEHHDFGEHQVDLGEHHFEHAPEHHDEHGYGYSIQHISAPHHGHEHSEHTSFVHHPHTVPHHTHPAFETSHHEPIIDHDGKPLDTPEVEKAKALHFAEVHKALARLHGHGHSLHRRDLGDYALHVEHETHGYELHQNHAPVYGHHEEHYGHHEVPQIGHDGKPLDTAEVEHAKALHFAAHQEALARNQHAKHHQHEEIAYHHF